MYNILIHLLEMITRMSFHFHAPAWLGVLVYTALISFRSAKVRQYNASVLALTWIKVWQYRNHWKHYLSSQIYVKQDGVLDWCGI